MDETTNSVKEKCPHNNHGHFFLWLFIWFMALDCSGSESRMKKDIQHLQSQVQQLQQQCNLQKINCLDVYSAHDYSSEFQTGE